MPPNWVVTWSYSTNSCVGTGVGYSISKITTQTTASVCSFSPLPAGWIVTGSYSTNSCYGSGTGYYIRKA
ncbi:hypothetical protein ACFP3U_32865 [Kitasatospora misakiensis]